MFSKIVEGSTELLIPEKGTFGATEKGRVKKPPIFYNPRMKLNRSVCCSVAKTLARDEEILFADLLAGSGAKGLRVAKEADCKVCLNDANKRACQLIRKNAKLNKLKVEISNKDANLFLQDGRFNFIDIDPFGTPVPFLDNAAMGVAKDGYLGVTATDTAPLCGVYPKSCFRKYGAKPLRSEFCHEVGLRILLGYIAKTCAKYGRGIKCLLSHSTEHYFRVYVKLSEGKENAKESLENMGYVYYCRKCMKREFMKEMVSSQKLCACGSAYEIAGPLWLGEIKDSEFVGRVLKESKYLEEKELENLLSMLAAEIEVPFYYDIHRICKEMKISAKPMNEIISGLQEKGYAASRTHFSLTSVKTDAPIGELKLLLV